MQTKAKANSVITHELREDGIIMFRVVGVPAPIEFNPDRMSEAMGHRAAIHGVIQRVSDGGALSRNPDTGKPATPMEKWTRMSRIAEHMQAGGDEWRLVAAGGGEADGGLVVMAMVKAGLAPDVDGANALVTAIATKRGIDRKASLAVWAATERVVVAIGEIRASRAKGDADTLLEEAMAE